MLVLFGCPRVLLWLLVPPLLQHQPSSSAAGDDVWWLKMADAWPTAQLGEAHRIHEVRKLVRRGIRSGEPCEGE